MARRCRHGSGPGRCRNLHATLLTSLTRAGTHRSSSTMRTTQIAWTTDHLLCGRAQSISGTIATTPGILPGNISTGRTNRTAHCRVPHAPGGDRRSRSSAMPCTHRSASWGTRIPCCITTEPGVCSRPRRRSSGTRRTRFGVHKRPGRHFISSQTAATASAAGSTTTTPRSSKTRCRSISTRANHCHSTRVS